MGIAFTVSPHYSEGAKPSKKLDKDPHLAPFSPQADSHLDEEPILYLPPLLSSLPPSHQLTHDVEGLIHTETHLPDIDPVSLSLHKALHRFRPVDDKYASRSYEEAFNWEEVGSRLGKDEERDWYIVAFRSLRRDGSDGKPLYTADKLAHEEAVQNGGLLMYWYGVPDPETGLNLATCIWQSRAHAIAANSRPEHARAAKLAKDSYSIYDLERYVLSKVAGQEGLEIRVYTGGDVGW